RAETWDVHVTRTSLDAALTGGRGPSADVTWVASFFGYVHRPYDEFAARLIAGMSAPQPPLAGPLFTTRGTGSPEIIVTSASPVGSDGWYWLIIVGLMGASYLFVRYLHNPLFVRNVTDSGTAHAETVRPSANCLVLGPPGSGTTQWMRDKARGAQFLDLRDV